MHWFFTTRIKPTSAYEVTWIYYNMNVVNLLHVSATCFGHLQGCIVLGLYYKDIKTNAQI